MSSQTIGSDFTGGALLPNYVNGRLLAAEDLATGQASLLTRDARIGRAAGAGVVQGLWVTSGATTLTVAAGTGVNPSGQPVVAARTITLPLALSATTTAGTAVFSRCSTGGTDSGVAAGAYLLTARPVQQRQGQVALAASPDSTLSPGCAARWTAEGVEIRAIALPALTTVLGVAATEGNLRNLTAHWCYGAEQLVDLPIFPFTFDRAYSGLDRLDPADLTDLDLPLAVFRWDGQRVVDLDNWSARRRITTPDPVTSGWSATVADRRDADGQARFLQFQEQIDLISAGGLARYTTATENFGLLPPVGFLPAAFQNGSLTASQDAASAATAARKSAAAFTGSLFDPWTFFGGAASYGGVVDWSVADFALRQSWQLPPELTSFNSDERGIHLTYYWVRENLEASETIPTYVVFMTNLPWQQSYGGGTVTKASDTEASEAGDTPKGTAT
ncbi:hypothetical protein ACFWPQ_28660 [Streptomyces sp. NPDC058464]|uniref:hypothetical protein n=1 Tax=Streptomyces sp. NPDC058464 TaxID=3346511 RepID=UPI003656B54D